MRSRARPLRSLLALPTLAWMLLFFLVPLGLVIVYSFATHQPGHVRHLASAGRSTNYRQIHDPLYFHTLRGRSCCRSAPPLGCLLLGFPLAYFISRQPPRWQKLLLVLVIVPFWTSFIVRTYALVNLLDNGGPLATCCTRCTC